MVLRFGRSLAGAAAIAISVTVLAQPAFADGKSDESLVYTYPYTSPGDLRTVDIEHTDLDHIVITWREQPTSGLGITDLGTVRYAYSADAGVTWSSAHDLWLADATWTYSNMELVEYEGDLFVYAMRHYASDTNGQNPESIVAKKSTDGGQTWSTLAISVTSPRPMVLGGKIIKFRNYWLMPSHHTPSQTNSVAISYDLVNWSWLGDVPKPSVKRLSEGFVSVAQDDPNKLVMVLRDSNTPAYSSDTAWISESTDGGVTWSEAVSMGSDVPNYNSKPFFALDANNRYLHLYTNDRARDGLDYRTKEACGAWSAPEPFADESNWDTYAMADEFAPGEFYVAWENDQHRVKFAVLDVGDEPQGVNSQWNDLLGWHVETNGGVVVLNDALGQLTLAGSGSPSPKVNRAVAPPDGQPFRVEFKAVVSDYSAGPPPAGISLATIVQTGAHRVVMGIQPDGVYAITATSGGAWTKVWNGTNDTNWHDWKVLVDASHVATLYKDGVSLATWGLQVSSAPAKVEHFVTGATGDQAQATITQTQVACI